jgi:hypothetical protein
MQDKTNVNVILLILVHGDRHFILCHLVDRSHLLVDALRLQKNGIDAKLDLERVHLFKALVHSQQVTHCC